MNTRRILFSLILVTGACQTPDYDVILRHGTVYDGTGTAPVVTDVAIAGDTIAAIGDLSDASAGMEIDARGLAVAPGFINMLSWATESLIEDGHSQSDIRQGVTLEVFGEGWSMGPLNESMKQESLEQQGDIKYEITWTTLGEYLEMLVQRGVSPNVASFVGATTVRIHELGEEDRAPTAEELSRMQALVQTAMEEGALGVGSSLGMYISHMRSEGNNLLGALEELITIAREAEIGAEVYHLKAAGQPNWGKIDAVVARIDSARWVERLKNPATRDRVVREMTTPTNAWENLYLAAGSPDNVLVVGFKEDSLKYLTGKTLTEVAALRGTSPEVTAIDLVIADHSRVGTVYFLMSEENVKRQIAIPWVSFGSDAGSMAPEGVFLRSNPHPRAYGNFARLLGKYVRDEGIISLEEAIRRLTTLPAENLKIERRGRLASGMYADVVVFDPDRIRDHATFAEPHQLAEGMVHVWVNGTAVLQDGEHTGATPGRVVRGPGWTGH